MKKRKPEKPTTETIPHLANVEHLLNGNGEVTLGRIATIKCAATAADRDQQLAMLVRRKGETLGALLTRLDKAIDLAYEEQHYIDEINDGPDDSI